MDKVVIFQATTRDVELVRLAASQKEISRADFIRQAIREKASRVLSSDDTAQVEGA
jgi:uncharacterized protein (DUF1778 family)